MRALLLSVGHAGVRQNETVTQAQDETRLRNYNVERFFLFFKTEMEMLRAGYTHTHTHTIDAAFFLLCFIFIYFLSDLLTRVVLSLS